MFRELVFTPDNLDTEELNVYSYLEQDFTIVEKDFKIEAHEQLTVKS